jgi:2-methylcitrate dehydratase PrpD
MNLHAKHPIDIAQIESVRVGLARRSVYVVGEPQERRRNPRNVVDCQFSTHLCLSIALKHRHMGWDDYEPALADPEIRALMQRIDVYEDAECESNFPTAFSGLVEIRTRDGQTWREFVYAPRGEPETMLSAAELRAKFSLLVSAALGAGGETALFNAIQAMDQPNAVDTLFVAPAGR